MRVVGVWERGRHGESTKGLQPTQEAAGEPGQARKAAQGWGRAMDASEKGLRRRKVHQSFRYPRPARACPGARRGAPPPPPAPPMSPSWTCPARPALGTEEGRDLDAEGRGFTFPNSQGSRPDSRDPFG